MNKPCPFCRKGTMESASVIINGIYVILLICNDCDQVIRASKFDEACGHIENHSDIISREQYDRAIFELMGDGCAGDYCRLYTECLSGNDKECILMQYIETGKEPNEASTTVDNN